MRETFTTLIQQSVDLITDPSTTASQTGLSDTATYVKKQINQLVRDLQARTNNFMTQNISTTSTVANQQGYYLPVDCHTIEAITVAVAGRNWPIQPVELDKWLELNRTVFASTQFPTYYLRREKDFLIWPTPGSSGNTITLYYNRILKDLTNADYTDGTVSVTSGVSTITGTGTTWTAAMVGRYFQVNNDGAWYRILSWTSTTSMTLETDYDGSTAAGVNYTIGESPEIPEQMHQFIPYGVAANYYGGVRRDQETAQTMLNYFYTGDYNNSSRDPQQCRSGVDYWVNYYNSQGRDTTGLTDRGIDSGGLFNDQFTNVTF
jgi:hypothetical protein